MINSLYDKCKSKLFKKYKLRSDFGNRVHLVNSLPTELRGKVRYDITLDQTATDEIFGIYELWLHGNRKLMVKQELHTEYIDSDNHLFRDEHIDGNIYYIDIGVTDLELNRTKFYIFDDYVDGHPKSVWVLVEDILEGYKHNYIPYMV